MMTTTATPLRCCRYNIHSSQYYRARRNRHQKKKMMCFGSPQMPATKAPKRLFLRKLRRRERLVGRRRRRKTREQGGRLHFCEGGGGGGCRSAHMNINTESVTCDIRTPLFATTPPRKNKRKSTRVFSVKNPKNQASKNPKNIRRE